MDVKAVANTQTSVQMNSQSSTLEQVKKMQQKEQLQNKDIEQQKIQKQQNVQKKEVSDEELQKATQTLQEKLSLLTNSQLKIETDKDTGIQVVKIIDQETKEVIRQIPPETVLKIAKYIDEITGLLFNKKA